MEAVSRETGQVFISPYDHLDVIAGQVGNEYWPAAFPASHSYPTEFRVVSSFILLGLVSLLCRFRLWEVCRSKVIWLMWNRKRVASLCKKRMNEMYE